MHVLLQDGREISVPLWWYPRLLHATPEQREKDLDVRGFLIGAKAPGAKSPVEA